MKIFTDQLGRTLQLPNYPLRIVSIVPSQTELLYYLGLENKVVGITKFCINPIEWFHSKPRVGGTKTLDMERIRKLRPDLIIANKEENEQSQIEALMQEYPVWISDINNLAEALDMIQGIGKITNTPTLAQKLIAEVKQGFDSIEPLPPTSTAYLIWRKPWMTAGHDTYINDLMQRCGMVNVFTDHDARYPEVTNEDITAAQPQLILLSSEPYPFKALHIAELRALCPQAKVMLVDGEMFSWYGSRMLEASGYLKGLVKRLQ